jgi:hypothetical protein
MSVDIEISLMPDYISLNCSGTCSSVSELNSVFQRAVALARDHQRRKILILANQVTGELTTQDRYEGAAFLTEQVFRAPEWISAIAVVGQPPLIDPARFGETVARNRGINGRVFTDVDEAVGWIDRAG